METQVRPSYSFPSIIAIIAAIISLFTGAFIGFALAALAIICGIIGIVLSLSPNVRGGFASTLGLVAGAVGIVVALIKAIAWVL
ncbi:hypothetical protein SDC9_181058 [bioreactor metagenome]|jgi:hypothetical protein|uniref:Uncharacterized protein n=1 Tax=bioreactor metagenome TaxID=1076179 RepID=A0A645H668_9ZZZZ